MISNTPIFHDLGAIRFFQVYIVQGILCVFFLLLAYRIITRKSTRLNLIFSAFYISEAIGLIINFIYAPLAIIPIVTILNFMTNFFSFYAVIFLLLFLLIISKSEAVFNKLKQRILIIITAILYFCMVFIAFIPQLGVEISAGNDYTPNWGLVFFLYLLILTMVSATIPTFYYILKVYNKFEDKSMKERWKFFLYGVILLYGFLYLVYFRNTFWPGSDISTVLSIIGLALVVCGSIAIYYGVGRQLD